MAMTQFTGLQYLMIDVANNFGLSKKDWSERLDWFKANDASWRAWSNLLKNQHCTMQGSRHTAKPNGVR